MPGSARPVPEWVDRLYPYNGVEPLHHYIQPGRHLTQAEHNLNKGAHKAHLQFYDDVIAGGREPTYLQYPQVALGSWFDRCCQEIPCFLPSLGRKLPDNLTRCSEYREEISEYAKFFPEYDPKDIRGEQNPLKCVPPEVLMDHFSNEWPFSYYQTVYARDFPVPKPGIPPQMFGWADRKRKKWNEQELDQEAIYCSTYAKGYDPSAYEKYTKLARQATLSKYVKYEDLREKERRIRFLEILDSERKFRDVCVDKLLSFQEKCSPTNRYCEELAARETRSR